MSTDIPSDLPFDLLFLILLRVPAEPVFNFRLVCKAWCRLIDNPNFIKSHITKWIINKEDDDSLDINHLFYVNDPRSQRREAVSFLSLTYFNHGDISCTQFESLTSVIYHKLHNRQSEFCSCNGLIVIKEHSRYWLSSWWMINPLTRKIHKLPVYDDWKLTTRKILEECSAGFAYDCAADDYKIVYHTLSVDGEFETFIYSLKSNCWKQVKNDCYGRIAMWNIKHDFGDPIGWIRGVFCNGALHWIGIKRYELGDDDQYYKYTVNIVGFDLESDDIRIVSILGELRFFETDLKLGYLVLGELGGNLSLTKYSDVGWTLLTKSEIYIMEKYGDENSWSLLYTQSTLGKMIPISYSAKEFLLLLLNRELNKFLLVNLKKKETETCEIPCTHPNIYSPQIFRPSLVRITQGPANNKLKEKQCTSKLLFSD